MASLLILPLQKRSGSSLPAAELEAAKRREDEDNESGSPRRPAQQEATRMD